MVAISLYRGNLHRVPDVPRRWLMPTRNISVRDFKSLLHRRSKALSRFISSTSSKITASPNPNPNPNLNSNSLIKLDGEGTKSNGSAPEGLMGIERVGVGGDGCLLKSVGGSDSKSYLPHQGSDPVENGGANAKDENPSVSTNPNTEANKEEGLLDDEGKRKRKREVEEKLKVLNEKKHNLVLVLKQILHVEEDLKRRSSGQGMASRPSAPPQGDATADTGEADDLTNPNAHSRQMLRTSSMSPSSESPLRRPAHIQSNVVSHPSRSNFGSPSCLPPTGQQGLPPNLPTVSVSGTNYIASSPSPAASGGTSVFRDARQPSPWN